MKVVDWLVEPYFQTLPTDLANLLAGIVWGQKKFLDIPTVELFRKTGLLHLLVLSGQNITLLLSFFAFIPRFFGYRVLLCMVVAIGLFYSITFPDDPSIIRASLMAIISSGVIFFDLQTLSLYIFLLTCAIMLILRPEWLASMSFWLSCSATAGILTIYPRLKSKHYLFDQIGLFFSAQMFTVPLVLLWFREYPVLSLFTNLSVMWLVEPIMLFGVLLSFLGHFSGLFILVLGTVTQGLLSIFLIIVQIGYRFSSVLIIRI